MVYCEEAYYWLIKRRDYEKDNCSILSFDFGNEVFVEIARPGAAGVWNKLLTFKCPCHIIKSCYYGFWDSSTVGFPN